MSSLSVSFSKAQLIKDARNALAAVLMFVGIVSVAHCGTGCTPLQYRADAEAAYAAEIRQCSFSAKTKEEAKQCRILVNARYGLCDAPWPTITPCDEDVADAGDQ